MSALANRPFVKMNGLGNEIVVVDMRNDAGRDQRRRRARRGAAGRRALRPADGALSAAHGGHRLARPHLQQRRLGGRRLRQRHALRRLADHQGERQGQARVRGRRPACSTPGRTPTGCSPSTWARRALPGTRFRSAEEFRDTRAIELQIGPIDKPILHSPSVVSMGNPHAIFWVDDVNAYDLAKFGPMLENHPMFPRARQHHALRGAVAASTSSSAPGSAAPA